MPIALYDWTAMLGSSLLAQVPAVPAAEEVSLRFHPLKLGLLLAWFWAGLFVVRCVDEGWVQRLGSYRLAVRLAGLLAGPVVLLAIGIRALRRKEIQSLLQRLPARIHQPLFRWLGWEKAEPAPEPSLRLLNTAGVELERYGRGRRGKAQAQIEDLIIEIIEDAMRQQASDLLLDPLDDTTYAVRFRIDGMLRTVRGLSEKTSKGIISSIKAVANMDIAEHRRPQDGAFMAQKGEHLQHFRVATAGARSGEKLSVRLLNQRLSTITMQDLGFAEPHRAAILRGLGKPSGMVLICGPTGSGKTTTMYCLINQLDLASRNVISVEDPVEARLPQVSQIEINAKAGITFASALRSILRQNPDVICVGEIRDEETAEIAFRAAQTGHLVLATLHCESNAAAIVRLIDLGVSPLLLSMGLSLLISQRLVRKLCPRCRIPVTYNAKVVEAFHQEGLHADHLYRSGGCEACGATGYSGRIAVCDVLTMNNELRAQLAGDPAVVVELRNRGEKKGRSHLRREILPLIATGVTTLDELKRVCG